MVTLEELQRSTAQVGESVHRTTISRTLHKSGFYGSFSSAGTEKLVRVDGKMDGAKYRATLKENLLEAAKDLRLKRFTLQQDHHPEQLQLSGLDQSLFVC